MSGGGVGGMGPIVGSDGNSFPALPATYARAVLTSYQRVLARPGALRFSLTGLVARLPISMVGLGIVLLVQSSTGSYGRTICRE